MEYALLGALEVIDAGVAVTPTAPKLRSTLAMLLVNHNRVVSRHTLIDEIWPENPPATAMMTLNTYVYQLRKLLARGPSARSDLLSTKPGGYELTIDSAGLDLSVFEQRVAAGRGEFAAGRYAEASCHLREALQLRRGPVLAGLNKGPLLAGIAARIEEDTLDAIALRIEIDMVLGRHRELIGELSALVAQCPMNEDFHAKLIVALYRSDRRSVALETYHRLRRSLSQHFGIDPSPRLKRLHQAILCDAPALLAPEFVGALT
jgi:DNA-binding SARP family transcriptional activator